jgi:hypothetical protein
MSKKIVAVTLDDETRELLKRIGKEVLFDDNNSHAVRYAVKYTAKQLLKEK